MRTSPWTTAVETGTIRNLDEPTMSTQRLARGLGRRGVLWSVDTSLDAILLSRSVVAGGPVRFHLGPGAGFLRGWGGPPIDFLLLDSANDPDTILEEFLAGWPHVPRGGVVFVDDAGVFPDGTPDPKSLPRKGHRIPGGAAAVGGRVVVLDGPRGPQIAVWKD